MNPILRWPVKYNVVITDIAIAIIGELIRIIFCFLFVELLTLLVPSNV